MKITSERITSDNESSISTVFVDGKFVCLFLEDEYREDKVMAETRIPAGTYDIKLKDFGGFNRRYGEKFPGMHKGMLWLQDVPNFTDILIHVGNTEKNTAGCLLTGTGAITRQGDMSVQSSVEAYKLLYSLAWKAAFAGHLTIEIIDRDRADDE